MRAPTVTLVKFEFPHRKCVGMCAKFSLSSARRYASTQQFFPNLGERGSCGGRARNRELSRNLCLSVLSKSWERAYNVIAHSEKFARKQIIPRIIFATSANSSFRYSFFFFFFYKNVRAHFKYLQMSVLLLPLSKVFYSKSASMSSLEEGLPLLAPLLGGVFRSGGSRYERSSIASTTLSGNSFKTTNWHIYWENSLEEILQLALWKKNGANTLWKRLPQYIADVYLHLVLPVRYPLRRWLRRDRNLSPTVCP